MFLQNVSKATQRKQPKKNDDLDQLLKPEDSTTKLDQDTTPSVPISYRESDGDIPKDVLLNFLISCKEEMSKDCNVLSIVIENRQRDTPLHMLGVEFQRKHMECKCGIEANYGCSYLSTIPNKFPDDEELINTAIQFVFASMKFFWDAVEMRGKSLQNKLKASGKIMPLNTIHEFFEACNTLMILPETKKALRAEFLSTSQPPNESIIKLQHGVLEKLGYQHEFGVKCLNNIKYDYPHDKSLPGRFQGFSLAAQLACQHATMEEDEVEEWFKQIPPFLRYTPHIYVSHQQQKSMMEQQRMQQQRMQHPGNGMDKAQAQDIMKLLSSAEGREKLKKLKVRMNNVRVDVTTELKTWNVDKKKFFIEAFNNSSALEEMISNDGVSNRMTAMVDMSDQDLSDIMTFEALAKEDAETNGSLGLKSIFKQKNSQDISSVFSALNMGGAGGMGHNHSHHHHGHGGYHHSHSHGGHGHSHNHGPGSGQRVAARDVSSGVATKMER